MYDELLRTAWVEIDHERLIGNIRAVQQRVGSSRIIGVVKGNAYGHGAVIVSRAYLECGVDLLGVATLTEAKQLRDAGIDCGIVMLGLIPEEYADVAIDLGVSPLVSTEAFARAVSDQAVRKGVSVDLYLAVDTGMGRIGYLPNEASLAEIERIAALPNVELTGYFSHFSSADLPDIAYTFLQRERFDRFYQMLVDRGIRIPIRTIANSPSIYRLPEVFYEAVRPGTVVWGCYPACVTDHDTVRVRPILSVKAKVIYLKTVPQGTAISYGRKFVTTRESRIATLPLGYVDGYTRAFLGKGRVLIRGEFAPILGTICMDQVMVDVTDLPDVQIGDEAVFLGEQGEQEIPVEELERASGLCSGELFYGFTCRLPIRLIMK